MGSSTSSTDRPLRVLVVDPDDRTRASLTGLLAIGSRCLVVGSAGDAERALSLATQVAPDVVLIDPRLPEVDTGRRLIARLRDVAPKVRVLVMGWSSASDPTSLDTGADAFVRKTFRPQELIQAVFAARDG